MKQKWGQPISHNVRSKTLGEERTILVYLPIGYSKAHKTYPVLYHLDGGEIYLGDILDFPEGDYSKDEIPELIYVSVMNTDRTRDMSPIQTNFCENPGADQFMKFFSVELIPFVDKNYRTSPFRILCGQSYSSVFALFVLLEQPSLFNGYITASLYFPQCREFFMKKAGEVFAKKNFEGQYLFMTLGALDFQYNKDNKTGLAINELIDIIKRNKSSGLRWAYQVYEDHGHVPEPSYGDGLKWLFNSGSSAD